MTDHSFHHGLIKGFLLAHSAPPEVVAALEMMRFEPMVRKAQRELRDYLERHSMEAKLREPSPPAVDAPPPIKRT